MIIQILMLLAAQGSSDWTPYDAADANLNTAYQAVMAHLSPAEKLRLRNEERAWIKSRDAKCGVSSRGACAVRFINARTAALEARLPSSAYYRSLSEPRLLAVERALNEQCRGGPGQDPDGPVCRHRDTAVSEMMRRGWCWGPDDAASNADSRWMRAGPRCHNS